MMKLIRRLNINLWYYRRPPWDTHVSPPELKEFIQTHPAGQALDIGCGTGTNLITLAESGWKVFGMDYAWKAVQLARQRMRIANLEADIWVSDVTKRWNRTETFDLILDIGCYHQLTRNGRLIYQNELHKRLAPGGTYLLYAHLAKTDDEKVHGLTSDDIQQFSKFLSLIKRNDGIDLHRGPSAWLTYTKD